MVTTISIIICSILLSAFFSGMEVAFVSSNKLKLELIIKQETLTARILHLFYRNPTQYITTMVMGNIFALIVYGIYSSQFMVDQVFSDNFIRNFPHWVLVIQIIALAFIIILTAEFLPKILFSISPNKMLSILAIPGIIIYIILYPLAKLTMFFSFFVSRYILGDKSDNYKTEFVFGKIDLDTLIEEEVAEDNQEDEHSIESQDIKIFKNALDFSEIKIKECLIPRTEIAAVELSEDVETVKQLFIETGYARVIVFKESIDNIIGYVHSSVLFRNPKSIKAMVSDVPIVPESMPAQKVLRRLNEENKGIAVVVDEFGGTEGIVTLEDIMEEIFGEIEDEHDKNDLIEKKISDTEYIFSGRQEIDYLNDKYNLYLPNEDDYETIAGLILHIKEDIPKINEEIHINEYFSFKILEVTNTRIEKVQLSIKDQKNNE
ncbi:CBS domain containing-hemolysin-like protein [Balneicella halophila]|uniref:CBS domain containing-hemolysin-like protein n=1 Tax=Balneicella halophila TaxID=1537566 RepID=A0A7L4UQB8_BALHA|nr:hemolysin family protein [Balneicella halophila]PVX50792.1 CBS domain containing-hemolysin-like protein [Balneicella halophila]